MTKKKWPRKCHPEMPEWFYWGDCCLFCSDKDKNSGNCTQAKKCLKSMGIRMSERKKYNGKDDNY